QMVFCVRIAGTLSDLGMSDRATAKDAIERALAHELDSERVLGYVFVDVGAFEKRLDFAEPESGALWSEGKTSASVILYGFLRSQRHLDRQRRRRSLARLLESHQVPDAHVLRAQI